jgi:excisionase family DNA binding protein
MVKEKLIFDELDSILSITDLSKFFKVTRPTIRKWIIDNNIHCVRIGRKVTVAKEVVIEFYSTHGEVAK